jgi:hypothetical protein
MQIPIDFHNNLTMKLSILGVLLLLLGSTDAFVPHASISQRTTSLFQSSTTEGKTIFEKKKTVDISPYVEESQGKKLAAVADISSDEDEEFKKGFAIIGLITLFNASLSPVWHIVFAGNGPTLPPLFLNAIVSITAFGGLLAGGSILDKSVDTVSTLATASEDEKWSAKSFRGGIELGLWKGLGT